MNEFLFENIDVGHNEEFSVVITEDMEKSFRQITGDINPLHRSDQFAEKIGNGRFKRHILFGMLTASFYSTLAGVYLPGKYSLIHSLDIKFQSPVYVGDRLTIRGEITGKQNELRLLQIKASIENQKVQIVSKASMKVLVMR